MSRAHDPLELVDYRSVQKHRDKVEAELYEYRARYGVVPTAEKLYARRLAEYDARLAELARKARS